MKIFLLLVLVFSFATAFGQRTTVSSTTDTSEMLPVVLDYKTHGYVNGIRLDSIETQYAEFTWKGGDGVSFHYGQISPKRKDLFVKNERNVPLVFLNRDRVFLLNFFYYNGWELFNITNPQNDGRYMLKKISN